MKRWLMALESTRPATIFKRNSDAGDIHHMIYWLAAHGLKIGFEDYVGKTKAELFSLVRAFHKVFVDDEKLMVALKATLGDDWELL